MQISVAVSGGIAVGKTTLCRELLLARPHCTLFEESPEEVAFLSDFYQDRKRWAFHSRMGMLAHFLHRRALLSSNAGDVIQDRFLQELMVFAQVQRRSGTLSEAEFSLYSDLYDHISEFQPRPAVIVRCICDPKIALERVRQRGREFESRVSVDYIAVIEAQYDDWLIAESKTTQVITVKTDIGVDAQAVWREIDQAVAT